MTIRRFDVTEDRVCEYEVYGDMVQDSSGAYVLFEDYHASHAYDEAKERELFELERFKIVPAYRKENGEYKDFMDEERWIGWKSCAKSRARSAE